ncbi:ARC6/PARC6 family protein [Synechocystis sp. PCC 7339]|uniref:ARC6/PARC6 family protein n=1 Tax=Synechocystis sp. PCC 7339 TaxID=2782213 RepID=UPI001CBCE4FC|nr:ARC6/PARC6 family protein [Synechocystis sp. PCC 7339]UAJ72058.1 ARC6/PARC6 family protein [Synechocystis sp. PCC 7339]
MPSKIFRILLLFIPLLSACQEYGSSNQAIANDSCSTTPQGELTSAMVEQITPGPAEETFTVDIDKGENLGFIFSGRQAQQVKLNHSDSLCVWLLTPNNQVIDGISLPMDGNYIVQVMAKNASDAQEVTISLQDTQASFNQQQALALIESWYATKPTIFASPFDQDIVAQLATGELYNRVLVNNNGGSAGWLKDNGCYYVYDYSRVNGVNSFSNTEEKPILNASVSERLKIQGSSEACGAGGFRAYTKDVTYWFEQDNGVWKIYNYEVGN